MLFFPHKQTGMFPPQKNVFYTLIVLDSVLKLKFIIKKSI